MSNLERFVAFFLPLATGLYLLLPSYFGGDLSMIPGDLGDTRFNIFLLEHCYQYFTGEVSDFWSAGFMYPEAEVISLSDNLLGSAPFYSVFRLLGFNLFTSFQLWAISMAILNYASAYLLVYYLSKKSWFAGIAGFIFAFSIGLAAQMSHAQTFPRFSIPLTLLFLLLWKDRHHWKWFFLASSALTYTFYCGIYLGFMTLIPFMVVFIASLLKQRLQLREQIGQWKHMLGYLFSISANILLLYKLFAPYLRRSEHSELFNYEQVKHSIPNIKSYLSSPPSAVFHGYTENLIGKDQFAYWDHWLFTGWIGILGGLSILFFLLGRKILDKSSFQNENTRYLLLAGIITFFFFFRINDYSLYSFLHEAPGFGAMRSMTRIINIELLFFGIGAALLFDTINRHVRNYRVFIFLVLIPILVFDNSLNPDLTGTTSKKEMIERHQRLINKMQEIPKGSVISYEPNPENYSSNIIYDQLDAMLAAQSLGLTSVNGYSARAAYRFGHYWGAPNQKNRKYWFDRFENISDEKVYIVK